MCGGGLDLCRLQLANDDKYYYYMFHIINAIHTMSFCFHDVSDETNSRLDFILSSHGLVSTKGYSLADMACFFFRHILNGMCAYSNGVSCQTIVPLSSADVSFRTFAVVNAGCCTNDMSSVLCESLGYLVDFEHQSTTLQEVLTVHIVVSLHLMNILKEIPTGNTIKLKCSLGYIERTQSLILIAEEVVDNL